MSNEKEFFILMFEIIVFLFIGYMFTVNILSVIYESFGISFTGNLWVNWFGVSYILFSLYTIIYKSRKKNNYLINGRLKSLVFWILLLVAIYIVSIPFIMGENPF